MNLMSCHGFLKNIKSVVISKITKIVLEYYFSKGFTLFECNTNSLEKIPNRGKQIINAEDKENYETVMTCTTTIHSTSNILKNLAIIFFFFFLYSRGIE